MDTNYNPTIVKTWILNNRPKGLTHSQIADGLNEAGIERRSGKPWDIYSVGSFISDHHIQAKRTRRKRKTRSDAGLPKLAPVKTAKPAVRDGVAEALKPVIREVLRDELKHLLKS